MLDSLYIGATGMNAQQMHVDMISNNLANVNTAGFKKGRLGFHDLFYRAAARTDPALAGDLQGQPGAGVGTIQMGKIFSAGELKKTDSPMDIAITGEGFIEVVLPDGGSAYTRNGSLQVTRDGMLATADGYLLRQHIQLPADTMTVQVDGGGKFLASVPNEKNPVEAGQLELVRFVNPAGLSALGDNLYAATENAGEPVIGKAGDPGFGTISQGYLEASNVRLVEELINLTIAQRAYEINAKVIQASDEMLGISNNLWR